MHGFRMAQTDADRVTIGTSKRCGNLPAEIVGDLRREDVALFGIRAQ